MFLIKLCTSTYFCLTAFWSLLKASKQAVNIAEHIRVFTQDNNSDKPSLFVLLFLHFKNTLKWEWNRLKTDISISVDLWHFLVFFFSLVSWLPASSVSFGGAEGQGKHSDSQHLKHREVHHVKHQSNQQRKHLALRWNTKNYICK